MENAVTKQTADSDNVSTDERRLLSSGRTIRLKMLLEKSFEDRGCTKPWHKSPQLLDVRRSLLKYRYRYWMVLFLRESV